MTPTDFIAAMLPGAQQCQHATGVPVGVTLAQAACESAWGTKAPGNNLFGIKADASWSGPTVSFLTHEELNGRWVEIAAAFRAYPDFASSLVDHGRFLRANPRYAACFATGSSIEFAKGVAAAGYATADNYAQTLCAIINGHNLTRYDTPAA
jgi:flagellar protein FlgJ